MNKKCSYPKCEEKANPKTDYCPKHETRKDWSRFVDFIDGK